MKKKMIKVLWIFLIFALTSNTKGFASARDRSLSIATIPVVSSDCFSSSNSPLTRGARGVLRLVVLSKAGIQFNSPLTSGARVGCVSSFHPAKKLSSSGSAIADTGSSSLTFYCISVISLKTSQVTSNNLSDIFIPPKITI